MHEFELYCWETMDAPSIHEYRSFIEELHSRKLPVCIGEHKLKKWVELQQYIKLTKPTEDLVLCLIPEMIVCESITGCSYDDRSYCSKCDNDNIKEGGRLFEIEGVKRVLEFMSCSLNYCYLCEIRLFNIKDWQYYEFI